MSLSSCLLVIAGGAIGTFFRYLVSILTLPVSERLPWGTIFINVSGSFIIGLFGTLTLADGRFPVSENARLFVMIGLCGGYTTFSAFSLQNLDLLRTDAVLRALLNVALSIILSTVAVAAGHLVASSLNQNSRAIAQIGIEEKAG